MSDTNPLIRFPLEVQEEVEQLRVNKQNALMITKIIESKFASKLAEQGFTVPSFNDINKYVKWAKKNRGSVPQSHSAVDDLYADIDDRTPISMEPVTVPIQSAAEDSVLQTSIDLSTPKNTLEDVKKRIQLSIQRLEKKRISLGEEYNDKLETTLRGYYVELSRLTHTEVKMAEELKDSDKIDVATVTYVMNKLFQCVASTIVEVDNDKRALFFSVLNDKVKHTKNKILEETIKEL